jgi:histidyl-tRNA synthetase
VCSGGRYDDLASLYTKQQLPGVGASVGLDRLVAALDELGQLKKRQSTADVLVTIADEPLAAYCASVAQQLRASGLNVELFPTAAKLAAQLKYADRKGIDLVVLLNEENARNATCTIKSMTSGEQDYNCNLEQTCSLLLARSGKDLTG